MVFSSASTPTNIWGNTYQPYGQGGIPVSSIVNDVRLPGQIYDAETGFHYNMFRDYIPSLGRYLESQTRLGFAVVLIRTSMPVPNPSIAYG